MKQVNEPQFTSEQELLLWSIRIDHIKDQRIAEILSAGVDWNYVRQTAIQQGIIPILYKRLKDKMSYLVPPEELAELRTLYMSNVVNNIRMTLNLFSVLDILAEGGIKVMPFKGPVLAVQAYNSLSMRSFCDLDILIHKSAIKNTNKILLATGHIQNYKYLREMDDIKLGNEIHFSHNDYELDVHWKIAPRFRMIDLDVESFWEGKKSINIFKRDLIVFSLEDNLLLLCVNVVMNVHLQLKHIADLIYLVYNHSDFSLPDVLHKAEKAHMKRILIIGLLYAKDYGGIILNKDIEEQLLNSSIAKKIVRERIKIIFNNKDDLKGFFVNKAIYFKSQGNLTNGFLFCYYFIIDFLLTPKRSDFHNSSLSKPLFFLYSLLRPFYLVKDFIRKN